MAQFILSDLAADDQAAILRDLNAKAGAQTAIKYRSLFSRLFDLLTDYRASAHRARLWAGGYHIGIVLPYLVI